MKKEEDAMKERPEENQTYLETVRKEYPDELEMAKVLLRFWDPLDLMEIESVPDDEYDLYAPYIVKRIILDRCDVETLTEHPTWIRTFWMGLEPNIGEDRRHAGQMIYLLRDKREA